MLETFDPEQTDLQRRADHGAHADRLLRLAEHLPLEERTLIVAAIADGRSAREIAALRGRAESPDQIRRRLRRLIARLASRRFTGALRLLPALHGTRRGVAELCFIRGASLRAAALELGLTMHAVRRHHGAIGALIEALHSGSKP